MHMLDPLEGLGGGSFGKRVAKAWEPTDRAFSDLEADMKQEL